MRIIIFQIYLLNYVMDIGLNLTYLLIKSILKIYVFLEELI